MSENENTFDLGVSGPSELERPPKSSSGRFIRSGHQNDSTGLPPSQPLHWFWWGGIGVDSMASYIIEVGVLTVGGPLPNQEFTVLTGTWSALNLKGTLMASTNRIRILGSC